MKTQDKKILIPCPKSYDFVTINDIIRCEGLQNNSRVYLRDGNVLTSNSSIGTIRKTLQEYNFYCSHKSHVVNVEHIVRYNKDGFVEMSDGSTAPVSRRNKETFLKTVILNKAILKPEINLSPKQIPINPTPVKMMA